MQQKPRQTRFAHVLNQGHAPTTTIHHQITTHQARSVQKPHIRTNNKSNFASGIGICTRHQRSNGIVYNSNNIALEILGNKFEIKEPRSQQIFNKCNIKAQTYITQT